MDFALWKAAKPGEPAWDSPWGKGRPGWHIECSAMALDLLGEGFDLHGAGDDLVFPHHENERVQAEGAGHPFARHWVHAGMVTKGGEKMAKSVGNFTTIADALDTYGANAFRLAAAQRALPPVDRARREGARGCGHRRRKAGRAHPACEPRAASTSTARRSTPRPSSSSAARWTTTSTRRMRSPRSSRPRRDANRAIDNGDVEAAASLVATVRELSGVLGIESASGRRRRRRDRRAWSVSATKLAPRATSHAATRSATSSRRAASSSRTVRAAPPGIDEPAARDRDQQKRDGEKRVTSASRSRGGGRCGSCSWRARRRVNEIWLSRRRRGDRGARPRAAHTRVRRVPADQLERRARTDAPQGVVAFAAPIVPADVDEMLADPAAFLVALDGVTDPQNLGAVMRTAETAGATGMVLPRHRAVGLTPAVAKAAAGALEYLPVAFVSGIPGVLERAARARRVVRGARRRRRHVGLRSAGRRPTARARPRRRRPRPVAASRASRCEVVASIPMHGHIESLNVSAAAAIACTEIARAAAAT